MADAGIVRNRLKIEADDRQRQGVSEADEASIARVVPLAGSGRQAVVVDRVKPGDVPPQSEASVRLSKALKREGFQVCRTHDGLRLYAIDGHGQRSPNELLASCGVRQVRPAADSHAAVHPRRSYPRTPVVRAGSGVFESLFQRSGAGRRQRTNRAARPPCHGHRVSDPIRGKRPPGFDSLARPLLVVDSFDRVSGRRSSVIRPAAALKISGSLGRLCGTWHGEDVYCVALRLSRALDHDRIARGICITNATSTATSTAISTHGDAQRLVRRAEPACCQQLGRFARHAFELDCDVTEPGFRKTLLDSASQPCRRLYDQRRF